MIQITPHMPEVGKTYVLAPRASYIDRSYQQTLWRVLDVNATHVLVVWAGGRRWIVSPERPHVLFLGDHLFTEVTPEFRETAFEADAFAATEGTPQVELFQSMSEAPSHMGPDGLVRVAWHGIQVSRQGMLVEATASKANGELLSYSVATSDPLKAEAIRRLVQQLEAEGEEVEAPPRPVFTGIQFHPTLLAQEMERDGARSRTET